MEAMMAQVTAVTDELAVLRSEIVQIKSAHANLHQASVEANTGANKRFGALERRIEAASTEAG